MATFKVMAAVHESESEDGACMPIFAPSIITWKHYVSLINKDLLMRMQYIVYRLPFSIRKELFLLVAYMFKGQCVIHACVISNLK